MSLVRPDGAADLYDGALRVSDAARLRVFDQIDVHLPQLLVEGSQTLDLHEVPHLRALGPDRGWYRVGPLAHPTTPATSTPALKPPAKIQSLEPWQAGDGLAGQHWARMIDMLHCAETIERLLGRPNITSTDLMGRSCLLGKPSCAKASA